MGETLRRRPLEEVLGERLERLLEEVSALASLGQEDEEGASLGQEDEEVSLKYLFSDSDDPARFLEEFSGEASDISDPGPPAQADREVGLEHPLSDADDPAEGATYQADGQAGSPAQADREVGFPAQADREVGLEHPFSDADDPARRATKAIRNIAGLARAVDMLPPGEVIKGKDDRAVCLFLRQAYIDLVTMPGGVNQGVLCAYYGHLLDILSREGEKQELGGTALYSEVKWQARICIRIIDALQGRREDRVDDQELKARCQGALETISAVVNRIGAYDDPPPVPSEAQRLLTVKWGVSLSDLAKAFDTVEKSGPFCLSLSAMEVFSMLLGYISTIDNFIRQRGDERPEENLRVRHKRYEEMIEILKQ